MEIPLLKDFVVICGLAIGVLLVCHRIRVPLIVGFFLTGVLCGPHAMGLVTNTHEVEILAKIGIVLLLFMVGVEFSLKKIFAYKRYFFLGGLLQVGLTVCVGYGVAQFLERPQGESLFLGFLLSLSSTAIVLRLLHARMEGRSPHGRLITGILIFQDVIVVPMMLMIPFLAGSQEMGELSPLFLLGKGVLLVMAVFVAAEFVVPRLLHHIARTRSRELFLMTLLVICFLVAGIADWMGLSLSIGAFLAGLIVSESEYSDQALGDVLPIQDLFTSFFFVSVGMLLDIHFVLDHPFMIALVVLGIMAMKFSIIALVGVVIGTPLRTVLLASFALCQVGEFSFVLAKTGWEYGLGSEFNYQLFLSVALFTMGFAPSLIQVAPKLVDWIMRAPIPHALKTGLKPLPQKEVPLHEGHVLIIGFGVSGKQMAHACRNLSIPYLILEMNPETVHRERLNGEPIHFGDATHDVVLKHANIHKAKALSISINDPVAHFRIVETARKLNPDLYILTRTRYLEEIEPLHALGANDVIPDEFGSSIEMLACILRHFHTPRDEIESFIKTIRSKGYRDLQTAHGGESPFLTMNLEGDEMQMETLRLSPDSSLCHQTLVQINLRKKWGLTLVMIKRNGHTITDIEASTELLPGDYLVFIATPTHLDAAKKELFSL